MNEPAPVHALEEKPGSGAFTFTGLRAGDPRHRMITSGAAVAAAAEAR